MKKIIISIAFGIMGLVFEWGLPFVVNLLLPGTEGLQHNSDDEVNRQLKTYFLFGGAVFFVLWAWIGAVFSENQRKACQMLIGVVIVALVMVTLPRLFPALQVMPDDWRFDALFVAIWGVASAALAYVMGCRSSSELSQR